MGNRGPKLKPEPTWSSEFAYAVGLLATDGCLSKDGRHITFVSKDLEQIENLKKALRLEHITVGHTRSGYNGKPCTRIQFGNVTLHRFLVRVGLTPNKSKTINTLNIPNKYFFDFLRGHLDGDGSAHSYWDSRWRSSFMFYTIFGSASEPHIRWLREEIYKRLKILGHVTGKVRLRTVYQLKYAKADSLKVLRAMYYANKVMCLSRKRLKIKKILRIVGERL